MNNVSKKLVKLAEDKNKLDRKEQNLTDMLKECEQALSHLEIADRLHWRLSGLEHGPVLIDGIRNSQITLQNMISVIKLNITDVQVTKEKLKK